MQSRSTLFTLLALCCFWNLAPGQNVQWTWMKGSKYHPRYPVYAGALGVAAAENSPGEQFSTPTWIDKSGRLWLITGGYTSSAGTAINLWRYDPAAGLWTWVKGANPSAATFGTQGVATPSNFPVGRSDAVTWVDANGDFWLFGGKSIDLGGYLNDLWRFDPDTNNWTWVKGNNKAQKPGIYGALGIAASANTPGAREGAIGWNDAYGRLWLYGGTGFNESSTDYGTLNDLWFFDPAIGNWTWVKGSKDTYDVIGVYGAKGIPAAGNTPGARQSSATWTDARGRLWLFGGLCWVNGEYGPTWVILNDLWRYDPATSLWTWMKGSDSSHYGSYNTAIAGAQGVEGPNYTPKGLGRHSAWTDTAGNFWLFGGVEPDSDNHYQHSNALWRFNPTTGNWAWFKGSQLPNQPASYGTRGMAAAANTPGGRAGALAWSGQNGKLWLMGGLYYNDILHVNFSPEVYNDLWNYDLASNQWTWGWGDTARYQTPVLGTQGTPGAANHPGARTQGAAATDPAGKLWLFGGTGFDGGDYLKYQGYHDDLWRFDPQTAQWTWMKGQRQAGTPAVYGTQGIPASANTPGGRRYATARFDTAGQLWLFGGESFHADHDTSPSLRNDLWRFDPATRFWTWIKGSQQLNPFGVYGTRGQEAAANTPGARMQCANWSDAQGRLWLFGGVGNYMGLYNDLWRFNPATGNWAVIRGDGTANGATVYGTQGQAAPNNTPGARSGAMTWTDASGAMWLFGGYGTTAYDPIGTPKGYLNDLWRFDPATQYWTWISGDAATNRAGVYGTRGVASPTNKPGARQDAITWVDSAGRLWLMGGKTWISYRYYNDLWYFNPATKLWTWAGGNAITNYSGYNASGVYGTLGRGAFDNVPGSRTGAMAWTGADGRMWLLGGEGYDCQGNSGILSDLWCFKFISGVGAWSRYE